MSSGMKITSLLALTFTLATPFLPGVDEPTPGVIDSHIAARSAGALAPRSDDAEFFRRVQLDLAGIIPQGSAVRSFLENTATDKRRAPSTGSLKATSSPATGLTCSASSC